MADWDKRFLDLARHIAGWSKDPSTQCGAVITAGKRIVSLGFNGFPQGVRDTNERLEDRETKYRLVLHAEQNALSFANRELHGCTIYVYPMPPCSRCAAQIIQAGIKRIVTKRPGADKLERWHADFDLANEMYRETGVDLKYL
jgi:dCMP deaminase